MKFPNIKAIVSNVLGGKKKIEKNFLSDMSGQKFSLVGNHVGGCGAIRIGLNTMYEIHKTNKMAFAYSKKISKMVGQKGLLEVDEKGDIVENSKILNEVYKYVGGKSNLSLFIADFFDQTFCSGQVFGVPSTINGLGIATKDSVFKVLDSRGMQMTPDKYGNVTKYTYSTTHGAETFTPMTITDYIAYRDVDYKHRGLSIYNSIVMNALTNNEAWRTQMYYFKNDARPNQYVMLHPEAFNGTAGNEKKEEFDRQRDNKYTGAQGAGKTMTSHLIKDIKTLDISNVDLDLINLTKENDNALSAVFLLDSRLIGLQKGTGSFGEVESTTIRQGNEQIATYGFMFSNFITRMYTQFVDPMFTGAIVADNSMFRNINQDKEVGLKETAGGVISVNEYRKKFNYEARPESEYDELKNQSTPAPSTTTK